MITQVRTKCQFEGLPLF